MAVQITMPQLGESVHEGTVARWLKREGEPVARFEPLVEIITDKVNAEVPSPVAGILQRIVAREGETVQVGREIAVIEEQRAPMQPPFPSTPSSQPVEAEAAAQTAPIATTRENGRRGTSPVLADRMTMVRKRSSPVVRRLAAEHGVDIQLIAGTGLGGRVTKSDLLQFLSRQQAAQRVSEPQIVEAVAAPPVMEAPVSIAAGPAPAEVAPPPAADEHIPLSPIRRTIAEHMTRSAQTIPHAWTIVQVDVSRLVALRSAVKGAFSERESVPLTYFPFFVKAIVEALTGHPALNASWGEQEIVQHRRIHVGIAVSVKDGLLVPVVRDADQKNVAGLAHAIHDLASRARAGQLRIEDVQGATITVNNPGAFGSVLSSPIIPQGQAAIVTMEAIVKRPVVIDDAIAIRSMMNVCCSFDHRILDGEAVGRFLQTVKQRLESFGPNYSVY